jgi:hypothetical protein
MFDIVMSSYYGTKETICFISKVDARKREKEKGRKVERNQLKMWSRF